MTHANEMYVCIAHTCRYRVCSIYICISYIACTALCSTILLDRHSCDVVCVHSAKLQTILAKQHDLG